MTFSAWNKKRFQTTKLRQRGRWTNFNTLSKLVAFCCLTERWVIQFASFRTCISNMLDWVVYNATSCHWRFEKSSFIFLLKTRKTGATLIFTLKTYVKIIVMSSNWYFEQWFSSVCLYLNRKLKSWVGCGHIFRHFVE